MGGGGATGSLNKGGGSNRLPGLVTKQQAVEFPQVLANINSYTYLYVTILVCDPTNDTIVLLSPCPTMLIGVIVKEYT